MQHLPRVCHLQRLRHLPPPAPEVGENELDGGRLWQAKQMSQPSLHIAIEALEMKVEWVQVEKRIIHFGVDVYLERFHHLPCRQNRMNECHRLPLELLIVGLQLETVVT